MKKVVLLAMLLLTLTGCKTRTGIKLDAIVDIPLNPTEAAVETTEPSTAPVEETTEATEAPTEQKTTTKKNNSNKKDTASKQEATQPPTVAATEPSTEAVTEPPTYNPSGYSPSGRDRDVAAAVNAQRTAAGLGELTLDSGLCAIASVRAWEASRLWSNSRPDGSNGITVLKEYGYSYSVAGENLYYGGAGGEGIVSKWMASDSRKANLLMESATAIGVGSYTTPDGVTYVAALITG